MNSLATTTSIFALLIFGAPYFISPANSVRQQIGQFYWVTWELDLAASRITIECEAQTTGFIGFGFARTPDVALMHEADIVIGGIDDINGGVYFSDRHGVNNNVPPRDASQDYTHIATSQNATFTTIKFSRAFVTGDPDDVDFILGPQTVIWSFGTSDDLVYHGGIDRGSFKLNWDQ